VWSPARGPDIHEREKGYLPSHAARDRSALDLSPLRGNPGRGAGGATNFWGRLGNCAQFSEMLEAGCLQRLKVTAVGGTKPNPELVIALSVGTARPTQSGPLGCVLTLRMQRGGQLQQLALGQRRQALQTVRGPKGAMPLRSRRISIRGADAFLWPMRRVGDRGLLGPEPVAKQISLHTRCSRASFR
jgi:hypothetical protein